MTGERELRFLAHARVSVREELLELFQGTVGHPFREEFSRLEHEGIFKCRSVVDPVDATFACLVPSVHPVEDVERSVHPEIDICRETTPQKVVPADQFE
jgi:hypothetical protein